MRTAGTGEAAGHVHQTSSEQPERTGHGPAAGAPARAASGPDEALPGLHLAVEAGGRRALLAARQVLEMVRLVALAPAAAGHPASLGTFRWRGQPVEALDLAALLGVGREPALDAQIAVLATTPPVGLVLDRVRGLHERPVAAPAAGGPGLAPVFGEVGGERLPLLNPRALAALLGQEGA